ncbi:MAG: SDR family oxidoreductase [Kiritimatiellae bacterium]|nr:SDR family oxidoreductase [Bacteroidales bacterium]MBR3222432.1 SDR family oxidoreductase [Kiritimatiellia bacterium]
MMDFLKRIVKGITGTVRNAPARIPVYVPVLQSELLKGRAALITGGSCGIGYAIAEAFLQAGAKVIISGRNEEKLKEAVSKLSCKGYASCIQMDNTKPASFAGILSDVDAFDILVNNAGYVGGGVFGSTSESEYDAVLDTNLKGAYFLAQEVASIWKSKGVRGNILNICSASSLRPGTSPYIISKWGMRSLTVGMAKQLIKHGIVVNGLAPGVTNTEHFTHGEKNIGKPSNPSGRMVTKEEIANMSVILVSPLCRMVVGDILYMTGGGAIITLDD